MRSSPHKFKFHELLSSATSAAVIDLGVFHASLPQPPTPQPSAGSELCDPRPSAMPIKYAIAALVPPPAETVDVASVDTVIV